MSKFLKRAREIIIKARSQVFSEYVGAHISSKKGEGYDFSEIKEYAFGDDIRHIDWTISAKLGQPHVKVFNEENRLSIAVVNLLGGSVYFGSQRLKQDVIAEINAILLFSGVKKQDIVRNFICTEKIDYESRFIKQSGAVQSEIEGILEFDPIGKSVDFDEISKTISKRLGKKSLIFLVGDFLDLVATNQLPNLSQIFKKHEVIAVVVRDRVEESLGEFQNSSFIDPSSKKSYSGLISKGTKNSYKKMIEDYDRELFSHFNKFKVRFTKVYTDEDVYKKILKAFGG